MGVGWHPGRTAGSQLLEPGVWSWLRGEGLSRGLEDGPASLGIHQGTESGGRNVVGAFTLNHLSGDSVSSCRRLDRLGMQGGRDSRRGSIRTSRSHPAPSSG